MSFYITLPSNVISNSQSNTQSDYTTEFPTPITLLNDYEVGLVEFSFREFIEIELGKIMINYEGQNNTWREYMIYAYENEPVEHFFDRINNDLIDYFTSLQYYKLKEIITNPYNTIYNFNLKRLKTEDKEFDPTLFQKTYEEIKKKCPQFKKLINTNNIILEIPSNVKVKFAGYVKKLFKLDNRTEFTSTFEFFILSELLNFYDVLYVYCDIVSYQRIGDQYGKLIRTITKTSEFNKSVEKIYTNPHYLPVSNQIINSINIRITAPTGIPVHFASDTSKVVVKLHFKPCRNN
jgi:hypothetical protein